MTGVAVQLYYREGCHLCEEMAAVLYRGWSRILEQVEWIDVDRDPVLAERYGRQIPVLRVDGEEICRFRADVARLTAVFGEPANPV